MEMGGELGDSGDHFSTLPVCCINEDGECRVLFDIFVVVCCCDVVGPSLSMTLLLVGCACSWGSLFV